MLTHSRETGRIGIMHLKRYWEKSLAKRGGTLPQNAFQEEWTLDTTLLCALGMGLEQTIQYLYHQTPDFHEFENWILQLNGGTIVPEKINAFNKLIIEEQSDSAKHRITSTVLDDADLQFWDVHGYIILRNAVAKEDCTAAINAISGFLAIDINDRSTWYQPHPARQGIMVQMFQHPALEKNRKAEKIRSAFEQLWGRKDLWMNTDKVSFNPPECDEWKFPGPRLHWDVSLELPIPFGLQGLLYLSDTKENQGAFTLVPGFHKRIEGWISSLPPGADPRKEDMYALGAQPIAANAGDFIIWHHALPHGSSANTAFVPRFVQYINYAPVDAEVKHKWI
ncbi:MAG TPA: phytanoyl-CoA dioxygenase family protein [Chitinophagaceae bacterium]|nr:phytanoyl-CoA dioxygenase family protein [Chitinophagaceae bacterium]